MFDPNIFLQDLRASTKKRDEIILEVAGLREDAKHRSHQIEHLAQDLARKQEEIEKLTRDCNEKEIKLEERERVFTSYGFNVTSVIGCRVLFSYLIGRNISLFSSFVQYK